MQLRILRTQEAIIKILKMRKVREKSYIFTIFSKKKWFFFQRISNAQLQTELVDILKNMFLPSKKMIKEQIEWLIEHKYMKRDEDNINMFIYMAWSNQLQTQFKILPSFRNKNIHTNQIQIQAFWVAEVAWVTFGNVPLNKVYHFTCISRQNSSWKLGIPWLKSTKLTM